LDVLHTKYLPTTRKGRLYLNALDVPVELIMVPINDKELMFNNISATAQ